MANINEMAAREVSLKRELLENYQNNIKNEKTRLAEEVRESINQAITDVILENDKLKGDNLLLTKELDEVRLEAMAQQTLEIGTAIASVGEKKNDRRLFTQGTLLLELPQLFDQ